MTDRRRYIPALRFRWLTPFYDFVLSRLMGEQAFKRRLIEQAGVEPGMRVLDLGCGTGTLTVMLQQVHPSALVTGLDGDPEVLDIARKKAAAAGVAIAFEQGFADQIPYPDGNFQRVLSSLVFHHLSADQKQAAFREVYRVLEKGGEFHLLDFGQPFSLYGRIAGELVARLEAAADNVRGALPGMVLTAGFEDLQETCRFTTLFGDIRIYKMRKRSQ